MTDKTQTPVGGDKHDYLSLAPYWWPNPGKSTGLPYLRHDGKLNPTRRGEHVDFDRKGRFFKQAHALGLAAFLTGYPKYRTMTVKLLEAWFVNPETRMNPNLNFAQGIPGISEGRPAGINEWCDVDRVILTIQLLRSKACLKAR